MPILIRELVITAFVSDKKVSGKEAQAPSAPGSIDVKQVVAEVFRILKTKEER